MFVLDNKTKVWMRLRRLIIAIASAIFFFCWVGHATHAQPSFIDSYKSSDIIAEPNTLVDIQYARPQSILIIPISSDIPEINNVDWYKGMHYYLNSRFGLPEVSFHYLVTDKGEYFEHDLSDIDWDLGVSGFGINNPIVIGYLTKPGSLGFSKSSIPGLEELILETANKHSIELSEVYIKKANFVEKENRQLEIELEEIFVGWRNDLNEIISRIIPEYNPIPRITLIELERVQFPEIGQDVLSEFETKLLIRNESRYPVYADSNQELILSLAENKSTSDYFYNGVWDTKTEIRLQNTGNNLNAGATKEFSVRMFVPLVTEDISEEFTITDFNGIELIDNSFEISTKVNTVDFQIVEVLETDAGYLNVRSAPGLAGEEVTRVSPGERFRVLESSVGWYKIVLQDGEEGWVSGRFASPIN